MHRLFDDENTELIRGTNSQLFEGFLKRYLPGAVVYRRAVAYFSSSVFDIAKGEFKEFFAKGGKMELVCSPTFSAADLESLFQSLYRTNPFPTNSSLPEAKKKLSGNQLLAWAVSTERLCIKIAVMENQSVYGIYHEKIGVLLYPNGKFLAVEGSANESGSAFRDNFERITIHRAFADRSYYAERIVTDFERLWGNDTPGVVVITLHEAFQRRLVHSRPIRSVGSFVQPKDPKMELDLPAEIIKLPSRLTLRSYQLDAIRSWFANDGKGVFSMATGSGKTITALATVEALFRKVGSPLVVIIVAPYLNLVEQWIEECEKFGLQPINCSGASQAWSRSADMALYLNQSKSRPILSLVTTNATFALEPFQRVLEKLNVRTILIADEVHNLGARNLSQKLPKKIVLRLGLSATPERWMDEDGTKLIEDYFGKVVFEYSLKDALSGHPSALCPYDYHPILVNLEDDEKEEYIEITRQLGRLMVAPQTENLSDAALALLLRRSRLIGCARQKMPAFRRAIQPFRNTRFNLVYCGDGRAEIESTSDSVAKTVAESSVIRQVDAVVAMLGNELKMNVAKYTSEVSKDERRMILRDFASGDKQVLVAIRCLDEGVDIPSVRRAFILASSTNPRQFIQRRGRVLRRADGKDRAEIFDFVVLPPLDELSPGSNEFNTLRNLVKREMSRVLEFADLATNGPQAKELLRPVLLKLKLMHI